MTPPLHLSPRRMSSPAEATPTEDIPTIETTADDGWTRIEHRLERLEDVTRESGSTMREVRGLLTKINDRQDEERRDHLEAERRRIDREEKRDAERAGFFAAVWATVKGPLTTVLLAAAGYATIRITGAPPTPTPVQIQYVERAGDHAVLPPQEPSPAPGAFGE